MKAPSKLKHHRLICTAFRTNYLLLNKLHNEAGRPVIFSSAHEKVIRFVLQNAELASTRPFKRHPDDASFVRRLRAVHLIEQ